MTYIADVQHELSALKYIIFKSKFIISSVFYCAVKR